MRELTVQVSDNQFDVLVNFLRTLPYVQLPTSLKRKQIKEKGLSNNKSNSRKSDFDLSSLGTIDYKPFDLANIKKNHSIDWSNFNEIVKAFKDIPLENNIEQHTILHTD